MAFEARHRHVRVLVVDDEPRLVDALLAYLEAENFIVDVAFDGEAALLAVERRTYDLVLLDLNLPKISGVEVFKALRERAPIPIIMITTRGDEIDRIVGLELGADDYLAKPFSMRELVARTRNVLRRVAPPVSVRSAGDVQCVGDLEIDRFGHEIRKGGTRIAVTPMEFRLLDALARNFGRALTRAQLLDLTTEPGSNVFDRTLDRHIANLRRKIEDEPIRPLYITTVPGIGYKLGA